MFACRLLPAEIEGREAKYAGRQDCRSFTQSETLASFHSILLYFVQQNVAYLLGKTILLYFVH
ncbi:hypothetical protein AMQ84_21965 [Paenibacillus riograndensis]|uniref:Uncharacterized protein n=1 Tax=Paenibacillus riograndensis TaxID=483937 RepID=A0A132TQU7_9BACL|nr:hypothetical protein AMQ84_21965 [Paenibacillus riograndensis]KWX88237.1 hypothetical protein AMQ83_08060 [Paenibacillus riograndensis]